MVAWGGRLHGDSMLFEEIGSSFGGIFGGASIATDMADVVAVGFVEGDDFVGGCAKTSGGFVFDEYG